MSLKGKDKICFATAHEFIYICQLQKLCVRTLTTLHNRAFAFCTLMEEIIQMQSDVRQINVEVSVRRYLVQVCRATRDHEEIALGASPRATMALYRTCQARAAIEGRTFVIPDDVKIMSPHVLIHRLIVNPQTRLRGRTAEDVIREVVDTVPVPVEAA